MSGAIVHFPKPFRHPLPADAIPSGKKRHAVVFPFEGAWAILETDETGGSFFTGLTKARALASGIEVVEIYRGTLSVVNRNIDDDEAQS